MKPCTNCKYDPSITGYKTLCAHPYSNELISEDTEIDDDGYPLCFRDIQNLKPDYTPKEIILNEDEYAK